MMVTRFFLYMLPAHPGHQCNFAYLIEAITGVRNNILHLTQAFSPVYTNTGMTDALARWRITIGVRSPRYQGQNAARVRSVFLKFMVTIYSKRHFKFHFTRVVTTIADFS